MIKNEISHLNGKRPAHRILVVEDDDDIRRLNTEVLIQSGYDVDAAEDGDAGWEALRLKSYDLLVTDNLVTDNNRPKVSGIELLMKLRAARMALPVIMATATFPKKDFTRYPWLEPAVTLPKPYTVDDLLETVKEVLHAVSGVRVDTAPPSNRQSPASSSWLRPMMSARHSG
jgi:DNA-binding response OmpR family regulator